LTDFGPKAAPHVPNQEDDSIVWRGRYWWRRECTRGSPYRKIGIYITYAIRKKEIVESAYDYVKTLKYHGSSRGIDDPERMLDCLLRHRNPSSMKAITHPNYRPGGQTRKRRDCNTPTKPWQCRGTHPCR
jgi:hypothetical protein